MENATDCYTIIKISPQDASLCAVKMPFRELPEAFGGHEEAIYFLLEKSQRCGHSWLLLLLLLLLLVFG